MWLCILCAEIYSAIQSITYMPKIKDPAGLTTSRLWVRCSTPQPLPTRHPTTDQIKLPAGEQCCAGSSLPDCALGLLPVQEVERQQGRHVTRGKTQLRSSRTVSLNEILSFHNKKTNYILLLQELMDMCRSVEPKILHFSSRKIKRKQYCQ